MVLLEKKEVHSQYLTLEEVTDALVWHSGEYHYDIANCQVKFRDGSSILEGHVQHGHPPSSLAAKVEEIGRGRYSIERYEEFPNGRDLTSFQPESYFSKLRLVLKALRFWK